MVKCDLIFTGDKAVELSISPGLLLEMKRHHLQGTRGIIVDQDLGDSGGSGGTRQEVMHKGSRSEVEFELNGVRCFWGTVVYLKSQRKRRNSPRAEKVLACSLHRLTCPTESHDVLKNATCFFS